jgi:hypothetical protein
MNRWKWVRGYKGYYKVAKSGKVKSELDNVREDLRRVLGKAIPHREPGRKPPGKRAKKFPRVPIAILRRRVIMMVWHTTKILPSGDGGVSCYVNN